MWNRSALVAYYKPFYCLGKVAYNRFALSQDIYSRRPNPSQELVDWIEDRGGINEILGRQALEIEKDGYDMPNAGAKPASKTAKTAKP